MGKVLVIAPAGTMRRHLVQGLRQLGQTPVAIAAGKLQPEMLSGVELVVCTARSVLATPRHRWTGLADHPQLWILEGSFSPQQLRERLASALSRCWGYLSTPFTPAELAAAVAALLARPAAAADPAAWDLAGGLRVYGCPVDLERRCIQCQDGSCQRLSETEAGLLRYLLTHRQRVVSREELLRQVWGIPVEGLITRTVDMHIARLRAKLRAVKPAGLAAPAIVTVRRRGYQIGPAWHCICDSAWTPAVF